MKIGSILYSSTLMVAAVATSTSTSNSRSLETKLGFDPKNSAVVIIDPQNDFLSPEGVTWGVVGESVTEHNTVEHIEMLFQAARDMEFLVFISPHYYYPHDKKWEFEGNLESLMHEIGMFDRADPLSLDDFEGSGADWLEQYKQYITGDNVVVTNPHKVYGPEANDLVLQLRKRRIDRVILAGMSANLCVESHLRELLEQGFEVHVVADGTAGAKHPVLGDGYSAALVNFNFIANGVLNTTDAITAMGADPATIDLGVPPPIEEVRRDAEEDSKSGAKIASVGTAGATMAVLTFVNMW